MITVYKTEILASFYTKFMLSMQAKSNTAATVAITTNSHHQSFKY